MLLQNKTKKKDIVKAINVSPCTITHELERKSKKIVSGNIGNKKPLIAANLLPDNQIDNIFSGNSGNYFEDFFRFVGILVDFVGFHKVTVVGTSANVVIGSCFETL